MTHDISSTPAESDPCMWGSATLVMLVSSTCMTVTSITEKVMAHLRKDCSGSPVAPGAGTVSAGPGSACSEVTDSKRNPYAASMAKPRRPLAQA